MPLLVVAVLLSLVLAAPAGASFSGSNGKVAWVDNAGGLIVDDPFDDAPAPPPLATVSMADADNPSAPHSPPAWSPDGTRIAYTEAIPDTDPYGDHSAVFVINADGS